MNQANQGGSAVSIVGMTDGGEKFCAAAGRISTMPGNAQDILALSGDPEKNSSLIRKVVDSGHTSVLEHIYFNLAFCDVSVMVEQFMIEFRLASFTVKSRRYVDFSDAGFYMPAFMLKELQTSYREHIEFLFTQYQELLNLDISREDARFVLPYCFQSNFLCSLNGRELQHVLHAMLYGRGKRYPELYDLGKQLAQQARKLAPGIFDSILELELDLQDALQLDDNVILPTERERTDVEVELLDYTPLVHRKAAKAALIRATQLSSAQIESVISDETQLESILKSVLNCTRPRALESVSLTFRLNRLSLASITHLVRHRMQSVSIPELVLVDKSDYIIPPAIQENPQALIAYKRAFEQNLYIARKFAEQGASDYDLVYLNLSGNTLDVVSSMNARELILFFRLRTCNRAQWEIRNYAKGMLKHARAVAPLLFNHYGPTCYFSGHCPEGRLTCGKQKQVQEEFRPENLR